MNYQKWFQKSQLQGHKSSLVTAANALYSASAKDLETVGCFFDFHEIKDSPRNTQKPETDFLVSRQAPQSASTKAFNWKFRTGFK
ncbi:MAG: hypothetical protein Q8835_03070 [Sweet potato little leaf phytoplasma]|nr:hypothetical protein [Sweet potato little leaf phytoplasma]